MTQDVHNAHIAVKSKCTYSMVHNAHMNADDRPESAKRLQQARLARGFKNARAAATYFGWKYESYIQHEKGMRGLNRASSEYAKAFRVPEAWLLGLQGDEKVPEAPPRSKDEITPDEESIIRRVSSLSNEQRAAVDKLLDVFHQMNSQTQK